MYIRILYWLVALLCYVSLFAVPIEASPPDGVTFITEIAGYSSDNWRPSLDRDNDGDLWVCSNGRVFENQDGEWIDHTMASGGGDYVNVTSQGTVWVASSAHLVSYDGEIWTDQSEGIPEEIRALSAEGGDVWLAYYYYNDELHQDHYGLVHYDGETVAMTEEGLLQNYISRLTATPGGVWVVYNNFYDQFDCVGTNCPKGTSFFDGETFYHFSSETGMPEHISMPDVTNVPWIVYSIYEKKVYAICNSYLVSYDNGQWPIIINERIADFPLVSGNDGKLWHGRLGINLGNGLSYKTGDSWYSFDFTDITTWMFDDIINGQYGPQWTHSIAAPGNDIVWFGITSGLVRVDTKQLSPITTGIDNEVPLSFKLKIVCFPNPFNNSTSIAFTLDTDAFVTLEIYDITGRKVKTLVDNRRNAGHHTTVFDGTGMASGVYIYRLRADSFSATGSMLLMK